MSTKVNDSAITSIKGSFTLFIGNTIALTVNAIGVILVARMLQPAEMGLFTVTLVLPSLVSLFTTWGINQTLVRFIARQQAENASMNTRSLIYTSYTFRLILAGILTLFLYLTGPLLSSSILKKPEVGNYVRLSAILVLSEAIFQTNISVFQGYENMTYRAIMNILQSLIKGALSPLLVYLGLGVSGVVIGHTSSYFIAGLIGLVLVIQQTNKLTSDVPEPPFLQVLLQIIIFGLPLFLSQIFLRISIQIKGIFLSWFIASEIIGNYGVANWFHLFIGTITNSIGVALFPAFSKYDYKTESKSLSEIYLGSVRYSTIFVIPITLLIISSSKSIIQFLFGTKYPSTPLYLSLLLVPSLFIGIGSLSIRRLLISQGLTRASLILDALSSILTIILSYSLTQFWGVEGLILSLIISSLSHCLLGSYLINKNFKIKHDVKHALKTVFTAGVSGGISYFIVDLIKTPHAFFDIFLTTLLFFTTYLILAPISGIIHERDINNLDKMLKNIKVLYPFAKIILNILEKLIRITS